MNIKKYKSKKISILGDSFSTFEGISIPKEASYYDMGRKLISGVTSISATWWGQVIEKFGAKLLVNNSISGSTVTWHPSYEIESYGCSDERTTSLSKEGIKPDIVMVYLGANDFGMGKLISSDDITDLSVFENAYRAMLVKLKTNYPNAEIWCMTLARCIGLILKDAKYPFSEYSNIICKCAKENGCKIIDLYKNVQSYETIDGFHPNSEGMKTIADAVIRLV